jgi:hypothetical protein
VTLFVPGPWKSAEDCAREVGEVDAKLDWLPNDGGFAAAFGFARLPEPELKAVGEAPGAAIADMQLELDRQHDALLAVGKALGRAGGLAVRVEQSKASASMASWLEWMGSGHLVGRYRSLVLHIPMKGTLFTCGMHLFSRPDAQIELGAEPQAASDWITIFGCYQIGDDPLLLSGQTFSPDDATPPRPIERWPDHRFSAQNPCYNPFGIWRVGAPGSRRRAPGEKAYYFTPLLTDALLAEEENVGRPLTREEVQKVVEGTPFLELEHAEVRKTERERGWADIDHEHAWEQWSIVRLARGRSPPQPN